MSTYSNSESMRPVSSGRDIHDMIEQFSNSELDDWLKISMHDSSGNGASIMRKMGWTPGEFLGKKRSALLDSCEGRKVCLDFFC